MLMLMLYCVCCSDDGGCWAFLPLLLLLFWWQGSLLPQNATVQNKTAEQAPEIEVPVPAGMAGASKKVFTTNCSECLWGNLCNDFTLRVSIIVKVSDNASNSFNRSNETTAQVNNSARLEAWPLPSTRLKHETLFVFKPLAVFY